MNCLPVAFLLALLMILLPFAGAQTLDVDLKAVIERFFKSFETHDTAALRNTCSDQLILQTVVHNREGQVTLRRENFESFVQFIGTPSSNSFRETVEFEAIHVDSCLASVWMPYVFYVNDKERHHGTNSFQLVKFAEGWKIVSIIDTRWLK